jgi:hypothetical protein
MVLPPNDLQKMVGMAIRVAIGCLDFDKRKCLMSWKAEMMWLNATGSGGQYKFIVNVTPSLFHDVTNMDAIMFSRPGSSSFSSSTPMPSHYASLILWFC